ncbi:MAG TPA: chloride channel protein [Rickettsiales bacterium]|nr:chloride channel protein [Rickettsiales bacterium]
MHTGLQNDRAYIRKAKRMLLSRSLWRKRLVFWMGAILVGLVASYFALLADWAQHTFNSMVKHSPWLPLIVSPTLFAFCTWITLRYFPSIPGSGIPQAMAARFLRDAQSRRYLVGPRVIVGKMLITIIGLLAGASIGREGPTVQVGAALLLLFAELGGLSAERGIVLAGASAGVAAAFNTPLAGIVFAIEEMARAFEHRNSSIVLAAIVFSGAAAMSISGNYNYFGYTMAELSINRDWLAIAVLGVAGGLFGSLFTVLIIHGGKFVKQLYHQFGSRNPIKFSALCGLIIASIGILTKGITYGTGYDMGYSLLHGTLDPAWWQAPAKLFVTALCAITGMPGGIFSPSLSVGAAMGGELAALFPHTPIQGIILLSMAAYFAGVTQAPITAFVIVLEITGKATTAVPLIAVALIAAALGRMLCPLSLYHALAKNFIADTKRWQTKQVEIKNQ